MTAKEFLESKGWDNFHDGDEYKTTTSELLQWLDEYAAQATTKIDVSKEFVNLTTKYEEGKYA